MELNFSFMFLAFCVFIAGFVDSIAGGGGVITIPAYLNYGVSEYFLLGTNKLSSTTGTFIAVFKYFSHTNFKKKYLFMIFVYSAVFSVLGAAFISSFPDYIIKIIVIFMVPFLSIYLLIKKDFALTDTSYMITSAQKNLRTLIISSLVSFYDGMLGPGTGTFLAAGYSKFVGYDILKSTALAKFTNLVSNIFALLTFLILGKVNIKLGLAMGFVSIFGNYLGSNIAIKNGTKTIKPMMVIISNLLLVKIIIEFINGK
ncbi:MAG: TSUP family transporter [Elusimicrobiota bacterium]